MSDTRTPSPTRTLLNSDGDLVRRVEVEGSSPSSPDGLRFYVTFEDDGSVSGFRVEQAWSDDDPPVRLGNPISAVTLRAIRFGEIVRSARSGLNWFARSDPSLASATDLGGRKRTTDVEYLARAAALYERAFLSGSRRPAEDVAEALGCKPQTARNLIRNARKEELIDETTPGRAGGRLTTKAIEILEGDGDS